jgi:hypothetical protein
MGYLKLKGDGTRLNGKCYTLPAAPLNFEGACLNAGGTAIVTNEMTGAPAADTAAKCKYACEDRGDQCSVYQFSSAGSPRCKLFRTLPSGVKGSAKKDADGMCYRDAH